MAVKRSFKADLNRNHDFFHEESWETTWAVDQDEDLAQEMEPGAYRMGRLRRLPDRFMGVRWKKDEGRKECAWFATQREAELYARGEKN